MSGAEDTGKLLGREANYQRNSCGGIERIENFARLLTRGDLAWMLIRRLCGGEERKRALTRVKGCRL